MTQAYLLLIDTAQPQSRVVLAPRRPGSAGQARTEEVVAEETWVFDPRRGPHVLEVVARVLAAAGVAQAEIARVAVVRGPGHWSLVRSGVVVATMLAEALGAELVSVGAGETAQQLEEAQRAQPTALVVPQYNASE